MVFSPLHPWPLRGWRAVDLDYLLAAQRVLTQQCLGHPFYLLDQCRCMIFADGRLAIVSHIEQSAEIERPEGCLRSLLVGDICLGGRHLLHTQRCREQERLSAASR